MNKVEQVARAICDAEQYHDDNARKECWQRHQHAYLAQARAAIKAMREPTNAMWDSGCQSLLDSGVNDVPAPVVFECWRAMIDAALTQLEEE